MTIFEISVAGAQPILFSVPLSGRGKGDGVRGGLRRESLAPFVALVVTVVWAISFVVDIFVKSYEAPASVHAAFMLAIGYLFGREFIKGDGK